jgi:hypothetical protein
MVPPLPWRTAFTVSPARRIAAFARDGAQPETLGGIERGGFQLAIVEGERLRQAVLQIKLAIIHAGQGFAHDRLNAVRVHAGALVEQRVGGGEIGHAGTPAAERTRTSAFRPHDTEGRPRRNRGIRLRGRQPCCSATVRRRFWML